jgi:hypothetical protein
MHLESIFFLLLDILFLPSTNIKMNQFGFVRQGFF